MYQCCFKYTTVSRKVVLQQTGNKLTRQCRKLLWLMVVFTVAWANLEVFQRGEHSTNTCIRSFSFLVSESPYTSIKKSRTLILPRSTHNASQHCCIDFYTFVGTTFVETAAFASLVFNTQWIIFRILLSENKSVFVQVETILYTCISSKEKKTLWSLIHDFCWIISFLILSL